MHSLPTISSPLTLLRRRPRLICSSTSSPAGTVVDETVDPTAPKSRLDTYLSSRITGVSRARVQSSIRKGLATVNGRVTDKVSHVIRGGDKVSFTVAELRPLRAEPEDIKLDIVFEDEHVIVVNKPAHMVVHPAPGNYDGTLVSAILHHCRLPTLECVANETSDDESEEIDGVHGSFKEMISSGNRDALIRPGIVHRLDKGTSGLLVVAKDEHSHAHLAEQFKSRTIHRIYISLTSGVPSPSSGRVEIPIARDSNNRLRMAAIIGSNNNRSARYAASRYKVMEAFLGSGSALVEWRLETGRTHQIRVHAKHLGIPLLGDELYGGTKSMALSLMRPRTSSKYHGELSQMISKFERPYLHALALGFKHPHTGEDLRFSCLPPDDFSEALGQLQKLSRLTAVGQ